MSGVSGCLGARSANRRRTSRMERQRALSAITATRTERQDRAPRRRVLEQSSTTGTGGDSESWQPGDNGREGSGLVDMNHPTSESLLTGPKTPIHGVIAAFSRGSMST
jgi:hypothetical protein